MVSKNVQFQGRMCSRGHQMWFAIRTRQGRIFETKRLRSPSILVSQRTPKMRTLPLLWVTSGESQNLGQSFRNFRAMSETVSWTWISIGKKYWSWHGQYSYLVHFLFLKKNSRVFSRVREIRNLGNALTSQPFKLSPKAVHALLLTILMATHFSMANASPLITMAALILIINSKTWKHAPKVTMF